MRHIKKDHETLHLAVDGRWIDADSWLQVLCTLQFVR